MRRRRCSDGIGAGAGPRDVDAMLLAFPVATPEFERATGTEERSRASGDELDAPLDETSATSVHGHKGFFFENSICGQSFCDARVTLTTMPVLVKVSKTHKWVVCRPLEK